MYLNPDTLNLVDVAFSPNSRPRNKLKQHGGGLFYYETNRGRPYAAKLAEYEQIALYDSAVSYALFLLIDTLIAHLSDISHPDEEIQNYLRYNVDRMGGLRDEKGNVDRGSQLYTSLYKMLHCTLWAGFSATESLYAVQDGKLFIDDFATYHPASIIIRPSAKGRLVEGDETFGPYRSGIYQTTNQGEVLLPMWKTVHLCRAEFYGNYYGISLIETIYKWYLLREAYVDMMSVALDRFGNPIVAITQPVYTTSEEIIDQDTGEPRKLTSTEVLQRQVSNQAFSGGGNVLILPQIDPTLEPKVQVLTTGNNIGTTFTDAINHCEKQMSKGLLVPFGLLSNDPNTAANITQRQMEVFNRILASVHKQFIKPILIQSFHRLIKMAFTRESANIPPKMNIKLVSRPEDRVDLMQVIIGLTTNGFINPTNEEDWNAIREMTDLPERDYTDHDLEYAKTRVVYPLIKTTGGGSGASGSSNRDRTTENKVKGSGTKAGRPIGTSAPKNTVAVPK
jgi:hypothetical protein